MVHITLSCSDTYFSYHIKTFIQKCIYCLISVIEIWWKNVMVLVQRWSNTMYFCFTFFTIFCYFPIISLMVLIIYHPKGINNELVNESLTLLMSLCLLKRFPPQIFFETAFIVPKEGIRLKGTGCEFSSPM